MNQRWSIQCLDSFQLKCIAIVSMALDHKGQFCIRHKYGFDVWDGLHFRFSAFLLWKDFHTHDGRRYMGRLGVFALISEIPYDLAFRGVPLEYAHQNVFFTLLIGIGMMVLLERNREWPVKAVILLFAMWLAVLIRSDYNFRGILLIFVFYIFHESRWLAVTAGGLWNFLYQGVIQKYGVLSVLPLALYNGERGRKMKYFFYIFYPAHLLLLYGISRF